MFDKNQPHSEVYGITDDGHRYSQNGAKYKADGSLCKGSKETKGVNNVKVNKKLADENADLKAQLAALQAAQAPLVDESAIDVVDTEDMAVNADELPIVEALDTDQGNSKGKAYKTAESAQSTIKTGENLVVIRAADGYYLRNAS